MELYHFKYFEAVARNKSFTKAAEELHISQPSLSHAIKLLEKEIGCQLLERSTREVHLTEVGIVFNKHAINMIKQFQIVNKEMEEIKRLGTGEVNIGIIESAKYWIPKVLAAFQKRYPKTKVKITELIDMKNIEEALINYDIHFSIAPNRPNVTMNTYLPIYQEDFELIVPSRHPFIETDGVQMSDLRDEQFILTQSDYPTRQIIMEACQESGFEPEVIYELERLETACSLVTAGLGISILPKNYLGYTHSTMINRIPIHAPTPSRTVYIAYHSKRYLTPIVQDLMAGILEFFRD